VSGDGDERDPFLRELAEAGVEESDAMDALVDGLEPAPLPSALRARILASVKAESRFLSFADQVAALVDVAVDRAKELLLGIDAEESWGDSIVPAMRLYNFDGGPSVANAITGFVRMPPGSAFPHHVHVGQETVLVLQGQFREDLYYRLNVVNIKIPTLDDRREDIPLLVANFLQIIALEAGQERKVYAPEAVEMLVTAEWPGNIRQLYNVVRQNVALSRSPVISGELVQQSLGEHAGKLASFSDARDEFTRNYLSQILQITMGNVSQAARLAKRNRTDFYKLLARHDLNPDTFKSR